MSRDNDPQPTREERLAAKLRENLRRRKAQSRRIAGAESPESADSGLSNAGPKSYPHTPDR